MFPYLNSAVPIFRLLNFEPGCMVLFRSDENSINVRTIFSFHAQYYLKKVYSYQNKQNALHEYYLHCDWFEYVRFFNQV